MDTQAVTGEQQATPPVAATQEAGQISQPTETQEKNVPLAALEDERVKRQQYEREAETLRKKVQLMEQAAVQQQAPKYDPEDIPSFKDVESLLNERESRIRADSRKEQIGRQVELARQKHSDWDEVYQLGCKMAEENPGMADVIMNSANPAMTAYDYGRLHPSYAEKTKARVTQELAEKINGNLNSQKTLSDAGGGGTPSIEKDWKKMASTPEGRREIRERAEQIKFGRR